MKKAAIIGGRLQGIEAAYLAKKAGMRSLIIDKDCNAPAFGLCDEKAVYDVLKKESDMAQLLRGADIIIPALENSKVHTALAELAEKYHLNLAFDLDAYAVTSSKLACDRLMGEHGVPAPGCFPHCKAPYIIKPSGGSGSAGVRKAAARNEVEDFLALVPNPKDYVVQEYLPGKSYSIEVIGMPGHYKTYGITQIHIDKLYDCKKVTAPSGLTAKQSAGFQRTAAELARLVGLRGLMDVEAIEDGEVLKVLEMDARIPSQTPTVVYKATGINLLEELAGLAELTGAAKAESGGQEMHKAVSPRQGEKFVSYEHFLIGPGRVFARGEHIMGGAGILSYRENFFGADEVLCDFKTGGLPWRGTFINSADSLKELRRKQAKMKRMLRAAAGQIGKRRIAGGHPAD